MNDGDLSHAKRFWDAPPGPLAAPRSDRRYFKPSCRQDVRSRPVETILALLKLAVFVVGTALMYVGAVLIVRGVMGWMR